VSLPERWYCFTTCPFCATSKAISSLSRLGSRLNSLRLTSLRESRILNVFHPLG
jgi:hypothetical protein